MTAAQLVRSLRQRHRLSQRSLARRAGTSQSWISDVERGRVSPTEAGLRRLLLCMGQELVLDSRRLHGHRAHNPDQVARVRRASMSERLDDAAAWAEIMGDLRPPR